MENSLIHLHPDKCPLNKCHLPGEKEVRVKNRGRGKKIVSFDRVNKDDSDGNPCGYDNKTACARQMASITDTLDHGNCVLV